MKKQLLFCCIILLSFAIKAQNIAIPNYNQQKIDFYLGTASTPSNTLSSGLGNVNGVTFYGSDMFVAGGSSGILWYAGVSFNPYNLGGITPTALSTGSGTIQVVADANGNVYVANENGTVTKFIKSTNYTTKVTTRFNWSAVAGLGIDNVTNTIWVVLFNNLIAVCKLSDFSEYTSNVAPYVKRILDSGTTPSTRIFWLPEGIARSPSGDIWVANNNDTWNGTPNTNTTLVKIKSTTVTNIVNSLNATSNADYVLTASDYSSYNTPTNSMLGGMTFDATYSNKMYVNNQRNGFASYQYSFDPSLSSPTFTTTPYIQGYPGNGQSAIIPCALLPNAIANSTTINSGQTANLSANNCVAGASYQWKDGSSIVGTNASFTTPVLNANKTYTVACINSTACTGTPTNVTVTVTPACSTPTNPTSVSANLATINAGATSVLTASGCAAGNTYLWKQGSTQVSTSSSFTTPPLQSNTSYTAFCVNGSCVSSGSNLTVNVNNPNQLPPSALVGYLHNWDDSGNGLPYIQLDNVPAAYNVINYAFGVAQAGTTDNIQLTLPTNVDANASTRTNTFIQKMNVLQNQGKKVLLSLGGSVSDGGVINVGTTTKRDNFITSVTNLLNTYPFDGLDIDIESGTAGNGTSTLIFNQAGMTINTPNSPTIDNLIYALKRIMLNYRSIRGKKMLLTFAPERHHVTGGLSSYAYNNIESSAAYLPIITALKDSLDLVHTQLYGYGSDLGKNGNEYCVGTEANALAVTEDLMLGYTLLNGQGTFAGLPSNKIALGLATPCNSASVGFLSTTKIQSVVNYFRGTGSQPLAESPTNCSWMTAQSPYTKISSGAIEFKGLMTWSINYDVNGSCSNNSFANTYTALYGSFVSSANTKNFLTFSFPSQVSSVINASTNTVTVTMPSGSNLASLIPSFTLSANTTTKKQSGVANNFTSPVQYTLNHQDNSSKTWTVIVNIAACTNPTNPTTASASPSTINSGQTITFTASGCASGNTYLWKGPDPAGPPSSIIIVSTSASFTLTPLETSTYTAHCVNGTCVSTGVDVPVTVNPAYNFTFGDCTQETLTGNFNYGTSSTGTLTIPIIVHNAGSVTFTVTTGVSGLISGSLNTTLSLGQTTVAIPVSYNGGQGSPFDVESTLNLIMVQSFQATPTNTPYSQYCFGNAFSPNPVISISANACAGQAVTLTASGCDNGTIQWYNGGSPFIFSQVGTGSTITHIPSTTNFLYRANCMLFSNLNSKVSGFSNIMNANPNLAPTAATASPSSINSGQTTTLTASGCVTGSLYLWKQGITQVSTAASFTTPALTLSTTYTAYCVNGTCISAGVNVPVIVNPTCTTPANPTAASASPSTINEGETTILNATGCAAGNSYRWKQNSLVVSSNASFTSSPLSINTTYTVFCVNGTCESSGTDVAVTVNPVGFSISPTKFFAICQPTATITAAGCSGTVNWYRDVDGSGATNQFLASGNTLTYTTDANWRQYIRATCTFGGVTSPLSNYCTVQTGPEIDPISYIVSPNTPFTLNASGCPSGTTYLWSTGETTPSITKSTSAYTLYFVRCVNNTCQSADGVAYISVGNVIANNDTYNLNVDTPLSANFNTNDGALSPRSIYVDYPPTHGTVVWDNTGAFTYTPTSNYSGTDSFTYYLTNGVGGYSNYATVTLNILCPTTLPLSSTNSPSDDFSAGVHKRQASSYNGTITATNKITGSATVNYLAKSIQLNAGFKADNGTVFKAEVGGCY